MSPTSQNKDQLVKTKAKKYRWCDQDVTEEDLETMRESIKQCITNMDVVDRPKRELRRFLEDAKLWERCLDRVLSHTDCTRKEYLAGWFFRDLYRKYNLGSWLSAVLSSELDD